MQYEIIGGNLPAVLCRLTRGESLYCESGAMAWMDPCMKMETEGGGAGKMLGRMFTGESLFRNKYVASEDGEIAFASCFPGEIRAVEVTPGKSVIAQKGAFLACESGVNMDIFFQKKISGGFFGGEGFIMQKFSGQGTVFMEIDGSAREYVLEAGQSKIIDTGYLVMMDDTCSMDIVTVPGIKNALFGGEGLFNTVVKGPGHVIIQSMPLSKAAGAIARYIPTKG